jgi:serine/threonine protein kinase
VAALQIAERKIYLKRYNYQGWVYALKDLFRRARARRVWIAANNCVMRDLRVARPLAYLERRRFGMLLESYLVTAAVYGEKLTPWLARHGRDFRQRRALIRALARSVGRMHERLVQNRDLKPDNLIVAQERPNSYAVFMVDFDGIEIGPVSWRMRMKNLARLERGFRGCAAITRPTA